MEVLSENARYYVDELEGDLLTSQSYEETERLLFDLSTYRRIAAISELLAGADVVSFVHHLLRSGEMRKRLLQQARSHGRLPNRFTCASQINPFFDALAAGAFSLSREIAVLTPGTWVTSDEFEDDFWYARVLYTLMLEDFERSEQVASAFDNYALTEAGEKSTRFLVCAAFLNRDQALFNEALDALIDERRAYFEAKAGSLVIKRLQFETERHIFIEGLALIRLAKRIGLRTATEYQFMPRMATLMTGTSNGAS